MSEKNNFVEFSKIFIQVWKNQVTSKENNFFQENILRDTSFIYVPLQLEKIMKLNEWRKGRVR